MTTTNNMVAKIAAAVAGLGLVFAAFAPAASAQSNEAMEAQIAALMAQIAALQAQSGGSASASMMFTRDLTIGASGADVTALQNWLIKGGYAIPAGATGYFGAQTAAALARYQAANSISPAAGYFGPITRAKVNASAGGNTGGNTDDDDDNDDDDNDDDDNDNDDNDDDNDGDLEGGAGDLESADFVSGLNNEDVGEDDTQEIAGLELEADDGSDLMITAVRVSFDDADEDNDGSDDFEDYAESVSIWFDGEEVASRDVDDIDEDDGEYSVTLSLDEDVIVRMEESEELIVAVTALNNIDSEDLDDNLFEVSFEQVRYEDADGATITEDSLDDIGEEDSREFEFTSFAEANDVELTIDEADNSPDEGTMEVDGGDEEVTLVIGELDAEGSDIEVKELGFTVTFASDISVGTTSTTTTDLEDLVSEFILLYDGEEIDSIDSDEALSGGTTTTATFRFEDIDDEDMMVEEGETKKFDIRAVIEELEDGDEVMLEIDIDADDIEAEGEDGEDLDEDEDEINGSVDGEEQTYRSEGLAVDFNEDDSDTDARTNVTEFRFELDVQAFGEDEDLDVANFNYTITRSGSTTITVNPSEELESDDFEDNGGTLVEVDDNEGRITYTVFIFADSTLDNGTYTVTLDNVTTDDGEVTNVDESLTDSLTFSS